MTFSLLFSLLIFYSCVHYFTDYFLVIFFACNIEKSQLNLGKLNVISGVDRSSLLPVNNRRSAVALVILYVSAPCAVTARVKSNAAVVFQSVVRCSVGPCDRLMWYTVPVLGYLEKGRAA